MALCIPVHGAHAEFVECLRAVIAHTPPDVSILVADDASPDDRSRRFLEELDGSIALAHRIFYTRSKENRGFVSTANDAFERLAPADVIVVNSDCLVTDGWFGAMTRAAQQSTLVATVSVLTNHGTILSLPHRNTPLPDLPQTIDLASAASSISSQSLRIYPRLPTVVGHCFYVRRLALDLVGPFDEAFSPGYGEEVDFAQRCVLHGLVHVVADDTFVLHRGSASFAVDNAPNPIKQLHDDMIAVRYPYYYDWTRAFSTERSGPFARALGVAERALRGLTVTIDGRCLTPVLTGTQLHTLEVIAALSHQGGAQLRVVVPHDLGQYASAVLEQLPQVTLLPASEIGPATERSDVVHRPFQVSSRDDLALLDELGERIVVTHQDLISFHNPGYFDSFKMWTAHRRLTAHALALADRVVFFSRAAAEEAIAEELVERERSEVVYIGTDHTLEQLPAEEEPPPMISQLHERPFLLCLGTDFAHKNRVFAMGVLAALRESHGWDGGLVLAGPHVTTGASSSEEAAFLALHPELESLVIDTAAIDEGPKRWLMRNAALMIYPSAHEGFGLVPFEAAEAGVVCAFAAQTSIAELLPASLALIEQWDAGATAARLAPYLSSPELRAEHIAAVRAAAAPLTWKQTARGLLGVYEQAVRSRASQSRRLVEDFVQERSALEATTTQLDNAKQRFSELERDYLELRQAFDETAEGLVGTKGVIPPELRRPLLAIGNRRALRVPLFGLLRFFYRSGYRLRHRGRPPRFDV
ncbi:MAG TPA: glycosyltransferase [Solirubrobacteraceae bacterium]|nr:glycosyltransferase [Solirubrobacteraceae bacterium]